MRASFSELELYSGLNPQVIKDYIDGIVKESYLQWAMFHPEETQGYIRDEMYERIVDEVMDIVMRRISPAILSMMQLVYVINNPDDLDEVLSTMVSVYVMNLGIENNTRMMGGDQNDAFNSLLEKIQEEDKKQP